MKEESTLRGAWEAYEREREKYEKEKKKKEEGIERVVYTGKRKRITFRVLPIVERVVREVEMLTDWNKYEVINYLIMRGYESMKEEEKRAFELIKKERERLKKWASEQ